MGSLLVAAVLFVAHAVQGQSPVARNASCTEEPTVEGCTIIRLKWSFKPDSGVCEQNYVCSNHANSFETRGDCTNVCPPTTGPRPGLQPRDCRYWLVHGASCGRQRTHSYWSGRKWCYIVLYTGCESWKNNYYAYDSCNNRCIGKRHRRVSKIVFVLVLPNALMRVSACNSIANPGHCDRFYEYEEEEGGSSQTPKTSNTL